MANVNNLVAEHPGYKLLAPYYLRGGVLVIFDILKASYGYTNSDETFLRSTNDKSFLYLETSFDNLVSNPPTTWLTAVKHAFIGFFDETRILDIILPADCISRHANRLRGRSPYLTIGKSSPIG
jgi:hypothetical protein